MGSYQFEVTVATATAIVYKRNCPYWVLIGDSWKHPHSVLPGGKIDRVDTVGAGNLEMAAMTCLCRELMEETGLVVAPQELHRIGIGRDTNRDVRIVTGRKLVDAVTEPTFDSVAILSDHLESVSVRASYGCPDYLYSIVCPSDEYRDSDELFNLRFFDIRTMEEQRLAAGHDVALLWYRWMLATGGPLPEGALLDFDRDRACLLSLKGQPHPRPPIRE